jgi:hypothetical protein
MFSARNQNLYEPAASYANRAASFSKAAASYFDSLKAKQRAVVLPVL